MNPYATELKVCLPNNDKLENRFHLSKGKIVIEKKYFTRTIYQLQQSNCGYPCTPLKFIAFKTKNR
jgi:hypothetical protein